MSIKVIDDFFAKEEQERELFPAKGKPSTKRSRCYRRRMFYTKEKNLSQDKLKEKNYCYPNNAKFVRAHLPELLAGKKVNAHGIIIEVVEKISDKEFNVILTNTINDSVDYINVRRFSKLRSNGKAYYSIYSNYNIGFNRSDKPVYYKKYYPNSSFAKEMANRSMRSHKLYDEDGVAIVPPKGNYFRRVYDSWNIRDW